MKQNKMKEFVFNNLRSQRQKSKMLFLKIDVYCINRKRKSSDDNFVDELDCLMYMIAPFEDILCRNKGRIESRRAKVNTEEDYMYRLVHRCNFVVTNNLFGVSMSLAIQTLIRS